MNRMPYMQRGRMRDAGLPFAHWLLHIPLNSVRSTASAAWAAWAAAGAHMLRFILYLMSPGTNDDASLLHSLRCVGYPII